MSEDDDKRNARNEAAINGMPWPTRATLSYIADISKRLKDVGIEMQSEFPGLSCALKSLNSVGKLSTGDLAALETQMIGIQQFTYTLLAQLQLRVGEVLMRYRVEPTGNESEGWPVTSILSKPEDDDLLPM